MIYFVLDKLVFFDELIHFTKVVKCMCIEKMLLSYPFGACKVCSDIPCFIPDTVNLCLLSLLLSLSVFVEVCQLSDLFK